MCFGSDAPTPPDPFAVAQAQTQSNVQTAQTQAALNAVDQYNPYGATTFLRDQNGDPFGQVSSLTPALSGLLGNQESIAGGLQGTEHALAGTLPTGGVNTDFGTQAHDAAQAAFDTQMNFLQPTFDRQNTALNVNLTDRGLPVGGEAWNSASNAQQQNQDLLTSQAGAQAVTAGNAEQNTLFGQSLAANQLPYQELAQTLNMNPASGILGQAPGAIGTSATTVQPTNTAQITQNSYQQQLNAYNQQQANMTQLGLGGASLALAFSDKNLKENRKAADGESILLDLGKLPVDHYDYKDVAKHHLGVPEHRTGPMAQDYAKVFGGDGHMIDLGDLSGKMLAAIQALDTRTKHLSKHA